MTFENKRLFGILLLVAALLLIPNIAMLFTDEVSWNWSDFLVAGVLLFGTGITCEFVLRKVRTFRYRLALCALILLTLFVAWAELAVGLIGTPLAGS